MEAKKTVDWAKKTEDWRQYNEKWAEKQDGFVEVKDSILASSWKKRWDNEFKIAKAEADIEVLDEALRLAADKKNQDELDAIQNSKKRAEERLAAAEEAIGEVDQDADVNAEDQQSSAREFGIVGFMSARDAAEEALFEANKKWSSKADSYEGGKTSKNKEDLEKKIEGAKEKIENARIKSEDLRKQGKDDRADKLDAAISRAEKMVSDWRDELSTIADSLDTGIYYSLLTRMNEEIDSLTALYEDQQQGPKVPPLSEVRKNMQRAISAAPDEEKQGLLDESIKTLDEIKQLKQEEAQNRNEMVKKIAENRGEEESDQKKFPKEFEVFKNYKEVEIKKEIEPYETAIKYFEEQGGKRPPEPKKEPKEELPSGSSGTSGSSGSSGSDGSSGSSGTSGEEGVSGGSGSDSAEVTAQKEKIEKIKAEITELEEKPISAKFDSGLKKIAIEQKQKELKAEEEKLEDIKSQGSAKKDESVDTASSKYMKFNDFVKMKNSK